MEYLDSIIAQREFPSNVNSLYFLNKNRPPDPNGLFLVTFNEFSRSDLLNKCNMAQGYNNQEETSNLRPSRSSQLAAQELDIMAEEVFFIPLKVS